MVSFTGVLCPQLRVGTDDVELAETTPAAAGGQGQETPKLSLAKLDICGFKGIQESPWLEEFLGGELDMGKTP